MASNAFRAALAATKASKNLDTMLVGSGSNYLPEGSHEVTIAAVGPATSRDGGVVENQMAITYQGDGGKTLVDRLFLLSSDGSDLSFGVRQLLSALIPDLKLIEQWMDIAILDDHALEMFTGMKCQITLGFRGTKDNNTTFQVRATGNGGFAAFLIDNKGNVGEKVTEDFPELGQAIDAAKGLGYKRGFPRIVGATCTHGESNAAAFATAVAGRNKSKRK